MRYLFVLALCAMSVGCAATRPAVINATVGGLNQANANYFTDKYAVEGVVYELHCTKPQGHEAHHCHTKRVSDGTLTTVVVDTDKLLKAKSLRDDINTKSIELGTCHSELLQGKVCLNQTHLMVALIDLRDTATDYMEDELSENEPSAYMIRATLEQVNHLIPPSMQE